MCGSGIRDGRSDPAGFRRGLLIVESTTISTEKTEI